MNKINGFKIPESFAEYMSLTSEQKMELWKRDKKVKVKKRIPKKKSPTQEGAKP